ncbi:MAG: DUF2282 domain-containing protein [Hyphomicrobiales bacterium]|nr:DUF2282 domain-containing protein [Hyphomicrobiales bacterium]MCP5371883.1 DUF2282 domain-containing protein [Hyphomicrobiales bacterium]
MVASAVAMAVAAAGTPAKAADKEKCYGVVKAGKNDCATANSSCAGTSKADGQKDAFIALPKGVCEKLVGGSLKPMKKG